VLLLILAASAAATASVPEVILIPGPANAMPVISPDKAARSCPPATPYDAARRGGKLSPRHLDELPPATAYMAVFRHIGGCEAPLTMVDYRNPRRR
jgi:hypothetical protein